MKVFFPQPFKEGGASIYLVDLIRGTASVSKALFMPMYPFKMNMVEVQTPEEADMVLVPQAVTSDSVEMKAYLDAILAQARQAGIFAALMIGGDLSHRLTFDEFIVLKGTQYKRYKKANEVIVPPICEDLGAMYGVQLRTKTSAPHGKPVVGFCGWAGFDSSVAYIKYVIRNAALTLRMFVTFDWSLGVLRKGLYFRRAALKVCGGAPTLDTRFIVRKSFSGNARTISLSEEDARREYVQNMLESDFVLAPKGDANYSVRFFEALSLGRIPVLIDTEVCLPLEDTIDYSKFIVRVDYRDISKIPDIVSKLYASLNDEEFVAMQKAARAAFETYLRYDSFFNLTLSRHIRNR